MGEKYNNESNRNYESRPLTEAEREELCFNSIKRIKPVLHALNEWAIDSLYSRRY